MRCHHDTLLGLRDRGREEIRPGHRAMPLVEEAEARRGARRHDGCVADLAAVIVEQAVAGNLGAALQICCHMSGRTFDPARL